MKKTLLTKSLALAALLFPAYAAAAENEVSASWKLGVKSLELVEGEVNPLTAGTTSCNIKTLTFNGTGSYAVSDGTFSYTKINMVNQTGGRVDDQYIEFTFTPSVSFTPTGFSFDIMNDGWGDGRYDVEVIRGEQTEKYVDTATPLRNNNTDLTVSSFNVSQQFTSFASSEEAVTLRIYLYSRNEQESRNIGLANVTISGLTGDVVLEPTEDELLARKNFIPGTLDITSFDHEGTNPRYQEAEKNIGYCSPNGWMSISGITCDKAGIYQVELDLYRYGDYAMQVTIFDADNNPEIDYTWNFPAIGNQNYTPVTFQLPGVLTEGKKTVKLVFLAPEGVSWVCNFRAPVFRKIADAPAEVTIPAIVGDAEDGFSFEAEEGVEYKLIVNGKAYDLVGSSFGTDHEAFATPGKVHEVALGVEDKVGESIYVLTAPGFKAEAAEDGMAAVTFIHEEGVHVLYQVGGGYDEELSTRSVGDILDEMAEGFGMSVYKDEPILVSKGASIKAAAVADNPSDPENMDKMLMTPLAEFTADIETGVETITADDLEGAEIYDLSGRRIEGEPAAGIYIYVKNGKSVKVAVR